MTTSNKRTGWISKVERALSAANEFSQSTEVWPSHDSRSTTSMMPELAYGRHRGPWDPNAKQAAVMILICPSKAMNAMKEGSERSWFIPLTLRHKDLADHAGQVSFPGGRVEPNEDHWESALRELHEELGIMASDVEFLGRLPPIHVFASNHLVHPFVAWSEKELVFQPSLREVEQVIEFPLGQVRKETRQMHRCDIEMSVPGFVRDDHFVWGATAIILDRFLELLSFAT